MNILVLDIENRVERIVDEVGKKSIDNSPFNPKNYLVSCNYRRIVNGVIESNNSIVFRHNDYVTDNSNIRFNIKLLQEVIDWADLIVAHNSKYDLTWLLECGFQFNNKQVWDTMIGEYILAKGVKIPLSLKETAIRRNVTLKKSELIDDLFDSGIGFEAIDLNVVLEYADADVLSCAEIFLQQLKDFDLDTNLNILPNPKTKLHQIATLMNDMLWFLIEIERNGICIDLETLDKVEIEFKEELDLLETRMKTIVEEVMGDTPINLRSGDDMTMVVYSRVITDKIKHKQIFNLGKDDRGFQKYPPYMLPTVFANSVKLTSQKVYRTVAEQCENCHGKGWIQKYKINGEAHKNTNVCKSCIGSGFVYIPTERIAGFKLIPTESSDASVGGFKVDKDTLDKLIEQANLKGNTLAVEFLKAKKRMNALNVYLNSFVEGIRRWTRENNILHAGFNQTMTATGRLSSSNPNFQNQPRDSTFPIRKCIVSRFENGSIIEADFSGLEFTIAGELSRDQQIIDDVLAGKDIHKQTGSIVHQIAMEEVTKEQRKLVKPYTFKPIYGGSSYGELPHIGRYIDNFFNIYKRHGEWQQEINEIVLKTGELETPSGRIYSFPYTKRNRSGKTNNHTKIVNYPVQGFATADIVPLASIRALRKFRELQLKSLLILEVHDSLISDTYPGEEQQVKEVFTWAMTEINEEIKARWNYDMFFKLKIEIEIGKNWLDKKVMVI